MTLQRQQVGVCRQTKDQLKRPKGANWDIIIAVTLNINPDWQNTLIQNGFGDFDSFMRPDCGEIVQGDPTKRVLRLTIDAPPTNPIVYLKQTLIEPRRLIFQIGMRGRRPHCDAYRESQAVELLRAHGFRTINIIARGELRFAGAPIRGFNLALESPGANLQDSFSQATQDRRLDLLGSVGLLTAQLHSAGFFHVVRLKDLILADSEAITESEPELTLIDRSTRWPWPRHCRRHLCQTALKRTAHRFKRNAICLSEEELTRFSTVYCNTIRSRWRANSTEVADLFKECLAY